MRHAFWAALALAGSAVAPAAAATHVMTFDALPALSLAPVWTEGAIVATGDVGIGYFTLPGTAHLDDAPVPYPSAITFTTPGVRFDAVSIDVIGFGSNYCPGDLCLAPVPYDDLVVTGFRNSGVVATASFSADGVTSLVFGAEFSDLDALRIAAVSPPDPSACLTFPCGHFSIDNVRLAAAVPEPATWALMLLGFGGLALAARRRAARLALSG